MTDNRSVTVTTALPSTEFLLLELRGKERLGRLFEFEADLVIEAKDVELDKILGTQINLAVELPDKSRRHFNGLVTEIAYAGMWDAYRRFKVTMRPWLWVLTRASDNRIFQHMSVPDIIAHVFKEQHGFADFRKSLSATYEPREYCVQYGESDFDFVSRLMEEEGIYYFFDHSETKHTLVLTDSSTGHKPIDGDEKIPYRAQGEAAIGLDHVFSWSKSHSVQSHVMTHDSYDYENPKASLRAQSKDSLKHGVAGQALYEYGKLYNKSARGTSLAKVRVQEQVTDYAVARGATTSRTARCGATFSLIDHPLTSENGKYLLVSTKYLITTGDVPGMHRDAEDRFEVEFSAINSTRQFRPQRRTPKSLVRGPQTAVVVGKAGEEIWTDAQGRIKVQFHWDREGKVDENSSCWVRVSQGWAGNGWGMMALPRIGHEVIVDFLEGDPDQPIVTGCVYNGDNKPPFALPDNQTQSGIRTRSTKGGDTKTFNELRFEDKKGAEEIYVHAQRNFTRVVEKDDKLSVGLEGDEGKGDQTIDIQNNRTVTLKDGNDSLTLEKGNQDVELQKGNQTVKLASGNQTIELSDGNQSLTLKDGSQKVDISKKIDIKAGDQLTITVGAAKLIMKKNGDITLQGKSITIKGNQAVKIKAAAQAEMKGAQTKVEGSAMLDLKGGAMAKLKGGVTMIG